MVSIFFWCKLHYDKLKNACPNITNCKRCGLKKLIYVVEGDPNFSEAAESIKTA